MPTVHNAVYTADGFSTTPTQTLGFTGTAGRALIVAVRVIGLTVTSVTDDQANSYTSLFSTNSDAIEFFMTDDASGVTTVTPTVSGSTTPNCLTLEVSGLDVAANQPQDTSAYASSGDGFVTSHGVEYTTLEANELVVLMNVSTSGARVTTGTSGATEVSTNSQIVNGIYEVIASAETADITWDVSSAANQEAALISLSPASTGSTSQRINNGLIR